MIDLMKSIIIPSYNTQKEYLEKCIDSIVQQPFEDFEIIIVDDGSEEIYRDDLIGIQEKDKRIQLFFNEHSGVSGTRNYGIQKAHGEYLVFVDADDIVPSQFLNHAVEIAHKYDYPDLIIGGIEYKPYRKCNDTQFGEKVDVYCGADVELLKKSMLHIRDPQVRYNILGSPCGKLYKRESVGTVLFPVGVALCEDQIFNRRVLLQIKSAVVIPEMWYTYIQNNFSVMHTKAVNRHWELKEKYWDELYEIDSCETIGMRDALRGVYVRSFFSVASMYCRNNKITMSMKKKVVREALNHPLIQLSARELNLRSNIPLDWKIQWMFVKFNHFIPIYILSQFIS